VLARFASGEAALVERPYGLGRVLVFANTLHAQTTNFPLKVSFLPLMHSLVTYITSAADAQSVRVGDNLRLQLPAEKAPPAVRAAWGPNQTREVKAERAGATAAYDFGPVLHAGCVQLEWMSNEKMETRSVSVNIDPDEGQLDSVALENELKWAHRLKTADDLQPLLVRIRQGRSLAFPLFMLALLVLLIESWLANRFAFGRGSRAEALPQPTPQAESKAS